MIMRVLFILVLLAISTKVSLSNAPYNYVAATGIVEWNSELAGGATQDVRDSIEFYADQLDNYLGGSVKILFKSSYAPKAYSEGKEVTIQCYDRSIALVDSLFPHHVAYFMAINPHDNTVLSNTTIRLPEAGLLSTASPTVVELIGARAEGVFVNSLENTSSEFVALAALYSIKSIVKDVFDFSNGDFGGELTEEDLNVLGFVKTNYPSHLRMEDQPVSARGATGSSYDFARLKLFNDNTNVSFLYADKIVPNAGPLTAYITSSDGIVNSMSDAMNAHSTRSEKFSFWYHKTSTGLYLKIDSKVSLTEAIEGYNKIFTDHIQGAATPPGGTQSNPCQGGGVDWSTLYSTFQFKTSIMPCYPSPSTQDAVFKKMVDNILGKGGLANSSLETFANAYADVYIGMGYGIGDSFLGTVQLFNMAARYFATDAMEKAWDSTTGVDFQTHFAMAAYKYVISDKGEKDWSEYVNELGASLGSAVKVKVVGFWTFIKDNAYTLLKATSFGAMNVIGEVVKSNVEMLSEAYLAINVVWDALGQLMTDMWADVRWQNGGRNFGWQLGTLLFEVVVEILTGGSYASLSAMRLSGKAMLEGLGATARTMVSKIKPSHIARLCRKAGCFIPSTQVATPLGLIPMSSIGPVFNPISIK